MAKIKNNYGITAEYVRSVLDYNPKTGVLIWIRKKSKYSKVKPGSIAGYKNNKHYNRVYISNKHYLEHRIIWLWMTGEWPKLEIDHINGNKSDNRWCNLREVTKSQNTWNRKKLKNNTTGYIGVYHIKKSNKYSAIINLGTFDTPEKAAVAYNKAAARLRGDFATLNEIKYV